MVIKIVNLIKYVINCLLDLIYYRDDYCCICNNYITDNQLLCSECYSKIKFCNRKYKLGEGNYSIYCYSAAYYSSIIKELIIRLKYKRDFNAGRILSYFLKQTIEKENIEYDIITFVPMRKKELKLRGYNQSEFLAKNISLNIYDNKVVKLIKKIKASKDQIGLNKEQRWENIKNCFEFIGECKFLSGKKILLVDDVMTTGATAYYCAEQLLENGAEKVVVITAAKSTL